MANRYPPTTRDRSPSRYDRRPSSTSFTPSAQRDPPRGPKADFRGGANNFGFNAAPRGRGAGFTARSNDGWDRDRDRERERPTPQPYRRDDDRAEWPRRDRDFPPADRTLTTTRENRPFGRERSASPIRSRRDSRESLPSTFARGPESTYYAPAGRGGPNRGRGRGDWDRGRGRNSFAGERDRDLFQPRSRSRENWRDRDFERGRPPPAEADRPGGYDRRDFDRSREREVRARDSREHDVWQRDASPLRTSNLNVAGSVPLSAVSSNDRPGKSDADLGRRASVVATPTNANRENRRDGEPADYFGSSRMEPSRRDPPQSSQQPAAAIGLDYGPPPSLPPVTTPITEKPAPLKPQPSKPDPAAPSSASFQPPSGPKAGRTPSLAQAGKLAAHQDSWNRTEPASRSIRSSLNPTSSHTSSEGLARKDGLPTEPRVSSIADRSMPPNVPSGPRLGGAPAKPLGLDARPAARESVKPSGSDIRPAIIPTGPRSERDVARPVHPPNPKPWSIPSNERPAFVPTGPRQQNAFTSQPQKPRISHVSGSPISGMPLGPRGSLSATSPRIQEAKMTLLPPRKPMDQQQESEDIDLSASASSEDEDEAEDDSFDEEYFAESEERHKREMRLLEARKPPSLLEDPTIVGLLFKLQFLEMISQKTVLKPSYPEAELRQQEESTAATLSTDPPASEQAPANLAPDMEQQSPEIWRRPMTQLPVNPRLTPPIENLPYLKSELPQREVFEESDSEVEHEAVAILLQQEFEREAWDLRADLDEMHAEFKYKYPLWKREVNLIEHEKRELQVSPAPASPAPSVAPSVTPSLTHERTRGARNTTEADLEAALLLSKQSAKEEEERREREAAASSVPNFDMEAVIPSMQRPEEVELSLFEDTNHLVPHDLVKYEYAYRPPEDDFTDEEQALFITAYVQTPKKWSRIASSLPGRTYQDCIQHYYLTKDFARYKEILKRSQPRKRGRGKAATKPRSTALMSELLRGGDDGEGGLVAVTDSGRPRRAAAPTFGDAPSEVDPATPIPQSRRLTAAPSNPDNPAPKTSRGRKAGSGTKPRRTKAQIQADQQQALLLGTVEASPGRAIPAAKGERGRTAMRAGDMGMTRLDAVPASQAPRIVEAGQQQYPATDTPLMSAIAQAGTTSAVTSYWSVPEQHKFPELLAYFGRDFAAIADFMKTKSVTMIKNYYSRQLNDGKDEFEKIALDGDQRRQAGAIIPQPPSPIAPAKRRYDTGSAPSLAPSTRPHLLPDQMLVDNDLLAPAIKQALTDDYSQGLHDRPATGEAPAKPRTMIRENTRELALAGSLIAKTEEPSRLSNDRIPMFGPKPHGPRAGFFQDDLGLQSSRQAFRQHLSEHSPQLLAQRLPDMSRSDAGQQVPMPVMAHSLHGQQEQSLQGSLRSPVLAAPLLQPLQSHAEKYQSSILHRPSHSRNSSLTTSGRSTLEHPEMSSLRRIQSQRPLFGNPVTVSPSLAATQMPMSHIPRTEIPQSIPVLPAAEAPKPPAKRSNVFGLLNDDPPEPPPKRASLETQQRATILSPRNAPVPPSQNLLQQSRSQLQSEDPMANRAIRGLYGHGNVIYTPGGQQTTADFPGAFSTPSSAVAPSNETWMDRFDPRTHGALAEQRSHRHSPAPSQYSVVPPGTQPPLMHGMRVDPARGLERPSMDHRRALLGPMNQIPHNPSPPPQQTTQPVPLLRSVSTSSQHSRVASLGFPASQQTSQSSSLGHPPAPQLHPQSSSSTPVPVLHHRTQSSLDFPGNATRLTIQQHMAQQTQHKHQEQQREHDRHLQRQRELEVAAHRDRERDRDREHQQQQQQHMRRDIYGIEHNHMAFGQLGALHQRQPSTQQGVPPVHLPHYHPGAHPAHYRSLSKGEERR